MEKKKLKVRVLKKRKKFMEGLIDNTAFKERRILKS